jgi:hypothetical protein
MRPVAGNFITFHSLRVRDDGRIEDALVVNFARCLVRLLYETVDRRAVRPGRLFIQSFENLIQPLNLLVCLL